MGLSLKVGKKQDEAANKFLEVAFLLFRSGKANWLWGLCGFVVFLSVSFIQVLLRIEKQDEQNVPNLSGGLIQQLLKQTLNDFSSLWGQL